MSSTEADETDHNEVELTALTTITTLPATRLTLTTTKTTTTTTTTDYYIPSSLFSHFHASFRALFVFTPALSSVTVNQLYRIQINVAIYHYTLPRRRNARIFFIITQQVYDLLSTLTGLKSILILSIAFVIIPAFLSISFRLCPFCLCIYQSVPICVSASIFLSAST